MQKSEKVQLNMRNNGASLATAIAVTLFYVICVLSIALVLEWLFASNMTGMSVVARNTIGAIIGFAYTFADMSLFLKRRLSPALVIVVIVALLPFYLWRLFQHSRIESPTKVTPVVRQMVIVSASTIKHIIIR